MFELKQVHVSGFYMHLKSREPFKMKYYFGIQTSSLSKHNLSQNKIPLHTCLYVEFLKSCFTSNIPLCTSYVFTACM